MVARSAKWRFVAVTVCLGLTVTETAKAESLTIAEGDAITLDGLRIYDTVTIAGTLFVSPFSSDDPNSGWLHLRAEKIVIASTGTIDADQRGYADAAMTNQGPAPGNTASTPDEASPGGGAAHAGNGAPGVHNSGQCSSFTGADGGLAHDTDPMNPLGELGLGSSGGAGASGGTYFNGGRGGGALLLRTPDLQLDGILSARGGSPSAILDSAPGGGAGGTIMIACNSCSLGPSASITTEGGIGAHNTSVIGGSGSGGLIIVQAEEDFSAQASVAGGNGNAPCEAETRGGNGVYAQLPAPGCIDVDQDGHANPLCGGDDCQDHLAKVSPSAVEVCDGLDNDCDPNSTEDQTNPQLCGGGTAKICVDGECVELDDSFGPSSGDQAEPGPEITLQGGLCTAIRPPNRNKTAYFFVVFLLCAAIFRRTR